MNSPSSSRNNKDRYSSHASCLGCMIRKSKSPPTQFGAGQGGWGKVLMGGALSFDDVGYLSCLCLPTAFPPSCTRKRKHVHRSRGCDWPPHPNRSQPRPDAQHPTVCQQRRCDFKVCSQFKKKSDRLYDIMTKLSPSLCVCVLLTRLRIFYYHHL